MHLDFHMRQGSFLLDIHLEIPDRGITAILGHSGAGKTTLLRCIAGLEQPDRGRLYVRGICLQDSARAHFVPSHQREIGYVFQEPSLFPHYTVKKNLDYGFSRTPAHKRQITFEQAVNWLGIGQLLERSPTHLSGGERQRVAIARAILISPRVLLLDEPLSSLDPVSKEGILRCLERLDEQLGIPVLYVSHVFSEAAQISDHMVFLKSGGIETSGPTPELIRNLNLIGGYGEEAEVILEARVISHDADFNLTTLESQAGHLHVAGAVSARRQSVRLRIQARDVSISLDRASDSSILNILPATVISLTDAAPGQVTVALDLSGIPLLAKITLKSARQLGLKPGLPVFAQIKSIALLG